MQCDFDKMCYYIDMLNKELYSSTIMKYNPSYCYEIVDTIASEYVSILSVLKNSAFFMEQANKTAFKYAKEDMINTWKKMMEKEIDTVVKMEYDKLISEIENSVSNYSSTTETNYE